MPSMVIPAHDEAGTLGRLLTRLAGTDDLDIVVVCNGCTDATADVARAFGPRVHVIETPVPSKRDALRLGDRAASGYPRFYVDADVEVGSGDVASMVQALQEPGVLAVAPSRVVPLDGVHWPVRWFYEVWQLLPGVQTSAFGRGVIGVSAEGHRRIRALPPLMSDDLAMSEAFTGEQRRIVTDARVVVHPPRTWADLVRRRVRAMTGNVQARASGVAGTSSQTRPADLVGIARQSPSLAVKVCVFVVTAAVARTAARRRVRAGDFSTWLRDESSRQRAEPSRSRRRPSSST
jgi:glycosyltransferase involved in cell wall biosynthesis